MWMKPVRCVLLVGLPGGLFLIFAGFSPGLGWRKGHFTMERRYRLQKNKAFQYVYHRGRSAACRDLVMLVAKGRGVKVGFSVSKKVGNAVTRNLVKRRLRECFRPYLGDVKSGLYIVVARPSAAKATFSSLQRDTRYLLNKHQALPTAKEAHAP